MAAKKAMPNKNRERNLFLAVCTIPTVALFCVFVVYPTFNVFYMSFFKMSSLSINQEFVGLRNFQTLIHDSVFWKAFHTQIFFILVVTVVTMACALFFAALLQQSNLREKPFYRTVFFFPNVLSMVVISVLFVQIYDPTMGILTSTLNALKLEKWNHAWLGETGTVLWCIAAAMIWQAIGYYMVMYMAGMDGIQKDLYEVADLEGMGKWRQFWKITLPLMWEIIRVTIVFFIISTINMSFIFVKVMAPNKVDSLLTYMYNQAFTNSNYGYAMAIGVFVFLFSFVLAIVSNRLTERETVQY